MKYRSDQSEIIDLGPQFYTVDEYEDCLWKLDRVGRWLGGDQCNLKALKSIPSKINSILDVGCGGGTFTIKMARHFPDANIVGIDINPLAHAFALKSMRMQKNLMGNVRFELRQQPELDEQDKSYDVVMATLVCHHLSDQSLIDFIERACRVARKKVILNDLHRHPLALYSFQALCPFIFRNRLVQHDGPLSVKRAFKKHEWEHYLKEAGLSKQQYRIEWKWAFRWMVEITPAPMNK